MAPGTIYTGTRGTCKGGVLIYFHSNSDQNRVLIQLKPEAELKGSVVVLGARKSQEVETSPPLRDRTHSAT